LEKITQMIRRLVELFRGKPSNNNGLKIDPYDKSEFSFVEKRKGKTVKHLNNTDFEVLN